MKITKIEIENYRLLKSFSVDLENDLSLILGKNNTGKTSLLSILDKFLNGYQITYDDFNNDVKTKLATQINSSVEKSIEDYTPFTIKLRIFIDYDLTDNLASVSNLILDLDPEKNSIILELSYGLEYEEYLRIRSDLSKAKISTKDEKRRYFSDNFSNYMGSVKRNIISLEDPKTYIDLNKNKIRMSSIISFRYINAKRTVANLENNRTLSTQTASIYKTMVESDEENLCLEELQTSLRKADKKLNSIYDKVFTDVITSVSKFGGIKPDQTRISISSTLQHKKLLEGNTTVLYDHDKHKLPEHYNGLGYMNLISMIFDIEVLINDFKQPDDETPTPLNLLFIEEPEAHTHPQMQYVFIKNIKNFIKEQISKNGTKNINLQTLISTHSSHIVVESDFDSIKYLKVEDKNNNRVNAKNLKDLKEEYVTNGEVKHFKFLKQYLTLNCAELFFADKIIMIEGDTERILLPAMMRKIDQDNPESIESPLLSQNISIISVGAHSQIFDKLITFLGVKTLIITDIDSVEIILEDGNNSPRACPVEYTQATRTSNSSLKYFFEKPLRDVTNQIEYFTSLDSMRKTLSKKRNTWVQDGAGKLCIAYQVKENDYYGRSFEDSFFCLNKDLLGSDSKTAFSSLTQKPVKDYIEGKIDPYKFANVAINSKPKLAIEVLFNSTHDDDSGKQFTNWEVPLYIKEGLLWLQKD